MRTERERGALKVVTYYVVQGFQMGKNGIMIADDPREIHGGKDRCVSAARRLKETRAGVVAFSRSGDPGMGDWDDAVVLWRDGIVPDEALAMAG